VSIPVQIGAPFTRVAVHTRSNGPSSAAAPRSVNPLQIGAPFTLRRLEPDGRGRFRPVSIPFRSGRRSHESMSPSHLAAKGHCVNPLQIGAPFTLPDGAFRPLGWEETVSIPFRSGHRSPVSVQNPDGMSSM